MKIVLVLVVLEGPMAAAPAPGSWDLSTADTAVTITASEGRIILRALRNAAGGHDWARGGASFPLLEKAWVGGKEIEVHWDFRGASVDRPTAAVVLTFDCPRPELELRSIWRARPGAGPVEHRVEIVNRSREEVVLAHQESLSLGGLSAGGPAQVRWIRRGGGNASDQGGTFTDPLARGLLRTLVSDCEDGSSPVPWLSVATPGRGGLYFGWEFSGLGRVEVRGAEGGDLFDVRVGNLPGFKTTVMPGETFHVPAAFVGAHEGDAEEGSYRLHRFILEKLRPPPPRGVPDPILAYNLYLDAGGNRAREEDVLRSARFCRSLGFEAFMPDAMWFPEVGDWRWDPARFPRGVRPIEEFVHSSGMAMALWCAWTNGGLSADPGALSVRGPVGHPEWFNGDFGPQWRPAEFSGGRICLGSPGARDWAIETTRRLVSSYRLDYLKHDIGPITNSCQKTGHRHGHGVDASYWAARGYYEVMDRLRESFPGLLLENCSGGGHIKDFGVIQRSHYTVTTDTLSNLPDRQSLYDSTFAFPPLILQAYTYDNYYPVPGDRPNTYLWRSAMMGAWQIDPTDTARWSEEEAESARRSAAMYKEWIRPLLADLKVHHVLPRPDGVSWDGLFYYGPSLGRGMLFVFRPDSKDPSRTVRLAGLEPGRRYRIWCEDGSIAPGTRTGGELLGAGLTVRLPERYSSDLISIEEEDPARPRSLEPPGEFLRREPAVKGDGFEAEAALSWEPSAGARSYRVAVSPDPDFREVLLERTVLLTSLALAGLPPGREFHFQVRANSHGGSRPASGGPSSFRTPEKKELRGISFASDLPWARWSAGAGNSVHRDTNYHGKTLAIAGKRYPKGLWTHSFDDGSPADVVIDIAGKGFSAFAADAGVEDSAGGGSLQFEVLVDGASRARSPVLRRGAVHRFRVDVGGAKEITLRALNGGDGYTCDHAAWGFARFIALGAEDPL